MAVSNPIFNMGTFWELYLLLESEELNENDVEEQINLLKRDFTVRKDVIEFEFQKKKNTAINKVAEFIFDCGDNYSLLLEYSLSPTGCQKSLSLKDKISNQKYEMGWWDLAHWHPFCLKLDELDLLLEYWKKFDPNWTDEAIPVLLLSQFVGVENAKTAETLINRVKNAFQVLKVTSLKPDPTDAVNNFVESENYRWELDPELGWLFTGDDYGCYSIRNSCHTDGDEGIFPFRKFTQMLSEIREGLRN